MRLSVLVCTLALCPAICLAVPVTGVFNSPDVGTDFLSGRWSEAYVGGGEGQIGNAIHAGSWDGTALYTEWELSAPAIDAAPTLVSNTVNGLGNGTRTWETTYAGGTLTLKNTGPWWNAADAPATSYAVAVDSYLHETTKVYVNNVEQSYRTTVYMTGTFVDYPAYQVAFTIASAVPMGQGTALPAGFPSFVGAGTGAWGHVQKITMLITPEPGTLALLMLSGLALLRRRSA